jgi:hypothetical protein
MVAFDLNLMKEGFGQVAKAMKVVKKIRVFRLARFQAFLMALLGLVAGIVYAFGGLFFDLLITLNLIASVETPGLGWGTALAFGALIGMPIIFALAGFVGGILEAMVLNYCGVWLRKLAPNISQFQSDL